MSCYWKIAGLQVEVFLGKILNPKLCPKCKCKIACGFMPTNVETPSQTMVPGLAAVSQRYDITLKSLT